MRVDTHFSALRERSPRKLRLVPRGARRRRRYRLLAITGEIVASRTLAIFSFGSLTLLNLIVSAFSAKPALNLKQKAEKTLIPFTRAAQLPSPGNDFACRESFLVNLEFWIIASPLMHTSS
jgi:hypothetical protein